MNNWILSLLHTEPGRRLQLQLLMNLVARSAGKKCPCLLGKSSGKGLELFACYSAQHLEDIGIQKQLYQESYRLGTLLRRVLNIKTEEQLTRTVLLLYGNIHIDMQGLLPGEVCVKQCYFSSYYTPGLCRIASQMDAGIISGLASGGELSFSQRITEGHKQCKAILKR